MIVITVNFGAYFTALGVIISLVSLALAISAKRESREFALLELTHQKRMLLSNRFAEISQITTSLRDYKFEDAEQKRAYEMILHLRNRMIDAMNESSELLLEPKKLERKRLLNEISDFNLMLAIQQSNVVLLKEIIENKTPKFGK